MRKSLLPDNFYYSLIALLLAGCLQLSSGCNDPVNFELEFGKDSTGVNIAGIKRKVLLINIQGAKGNVLEKADIPNITSLLPQSVYSWDAVCDTSSTDQAGWAALFTGVPNAKNGVLNDTYLNNQFDNYPSFVSRLKNNNNGLRIVSVNSVPSLNDTLVNSQEIDASITLDNDNTVADSVVAQLKNDDPDVLITTFSSVNEAGKNFGFSGIQASKAYMDAIHEVDSYIGDILDAMRSRKNYGNEKWLVIITSNHGGSPDGTYGGNNFDDRNTFVLYWNAGFPSKEIKRPFLNVPYDGVFPFFYGLYFNGSGDYIQPCGYSYDPVYNFGADQDFTFEFNVRIDPSNLPPAWASIIANKDYNSGSNRGYDVFLLDNRVGISFTGADKSRVDMRDNGPFVGDNQWHHVTLLFNRQGNIQAYLDGKFYSEGPSIQGDGNIDTEYPFVIGADGTMEKYPAFCYLGDVRVWTTLLSADVIKEWAFQPVTNKHPNYGSLIGNWKLTDDGPNATEFKDSGPLGMNLTVANNNELRWETVNGVLNPSNEDPLKAVPHSTDVALNILVWMGTMIQPSYDLNGVLYILQ